MRELFQLPDVGEGLTEAEISSWHVAPGDTVTVNQILVEIETAKAAVELPSPYAGTVGELLVEAGATVQVGAPIIAIETVGDPAPSTAAAGSAAGLSDNGAKIGEAGADGRIATLVGYGPRQGTASRRPRRTTGDAPVPPVVPEPPAAPEPPPPPPAPEPASPRAASGPSGGTVPLAKPPVRKLARDLGVDLYDVTGSGPHGRDHPRRRRGGRVRTGFSVRRSGAGRAGRRCRGCCRCRRCGRGGVATGVARAVGR